MPKEEREWNEHPALTKLDMHVEGEFDEGFRKRYYDCYVNCYCVKHVKEALLVEIENEFERLNELKAKTEKLPDSEESVIYIDMPECEACPDKDTCEAVEMSDCPREDI